MQMKAIMPPAETIDAEFSEPTVYPNPFDYALFIQVDNHDEFDLNIIDLNGRLVYSAQKLSGDQQLQLGEIPNGAYIMTITSEDKIFHSKLIKSE